MTKLSPRDQLIAVAIGAVVVVVLVVMFVLRPQLGRLGELVERQEAEQVKLEQARLSLKRLEALRAEAARTQANLIKLSRRIPEEAEIPSLLIELQDIADSAGLAFSSVSLDRPADKSGYAEIPLKIQIRGRFFAVVEYLYRLEHMTREVVVSNVRISAGEYPELSVDLTAKTFRLSAAPLTPPPGSPGAGQPAPAP